jgi:LysR family transcriptional regulator, glycine cleavage system transcriptional activator
MIAWKTLPPLSALRAFSAFAEAGSLAEAGGLLNVSHAAISQQLTALEAHMGIALLDRSGRGLALTAAGRMLAAALQSGFDEIAGAVETLTDRDHARPLHITTTSAFATGWLMPRLADFRACHPGVDLTIDASSEVRPLGPGGADIALRYGNGIWPGTEARLLLASSVVVVAAPKLIGDRVIRGVADLADLPWLQELGTNEASGFFDRHGVARDAAIGLTSLPGNLMLDAARDGQGIAVIARAFIEADIAAGRLRAMFDDREREGYFLVTRAGVQRPSARLFSSWALRLVKAENPTGG